MPLHLSWLHAPRWLAHAYLNRATALVLGVIGVSLVFGTLRVLDVALSDVSNAHRDRAVAMASGASGAASAADQWLVAEPVSAGKPVDASLVEVPDAAAAAISL